MLNNTITWNGVSSDTLGIRVERFPNLNRPQRKFEQVSVPGRNGDLFFFQDAWSNYEQSYEIFAGDGKLNDAPDAFNDIMPWLYPSEASPTIDDYINLTIGGYHRLIDSFEPDAIRLAVFSNSVEVANSWNRYGRSTLRFNCRPERFTADAFTAIDVDANTVSGDIATFEGDGSAVKDLTASIEPIQSGSGEPSPDNVRPISGWDAVKVTVSPTTEAEAGTTTTVTLPQTVYGGTLDVTTGVLKIDRRYAEYDGSSDEDWIIVTAISYTRFGITASGSSSVTARAGVLSNMGATKRTGHEAGTIFTSGSRLYYYAPTDITAVADFKTWLASNPLQVVYELATPTTVQLTPTEVTTLLGENNIWADSGSVEVTFNKPFRNPTDRDAKPFIKVYGSGNGVLTINDSRVTITGMVDYLHIDCEQQNCYRQLAENRNNLVSLSDGFPVLKPGDNSIGYSGGITKVEITPRWWRL